MDSDFDLGWQAREKIAHSDNAYLIALEEDAAAQADALFESIQYLFGKISKWGWTDYMDDVSPALEEYGRWKRARAERI